MSGAVALLEMARRAGVGVRPRLWADHPERLAPELRAALKAREAEVLALLVANDGPADPDPVGQAEAEAVRGEYAEPGHAVRLRSAREHAAEVAGLTRAGLLRPPSWGDPAALPSAGARCSCCGGGRWWCEVGAPSGWRCATCHPGDHLPDAARREQRTDTIRGK